MQEQPPRPSRTWSWTLLLVLLLALRLPSLAEPAGGDQQLYTYVAQRVLAGDVPYRDVFEQKPPAVFFVYAALRRVWPNESAVAAGDLIAAGLVAWLLVVMGRRLFGGRTGEGAAVAFLLLGDPSIQRLSGLAVRGQCEVFIALAVTAALAAIWRPERRPWSLVFAGACLAAAVWLKYNAVVYAVPAAAAVLWAPANRRADARRRIPELGWVAGGAAIVTASALAYFIAAGAFTDLWLATISYNLRYSRETYAGLLNAAGYVAALPVTHARVDGLWFFGGLGALALAARAWTHRPSRLILVWLMAAVASIGLNGARGLPQYFVQAGPALALAGAAGAAWAWHRGAVMRLALTACLVLGAWRVGTEPAPAWQPRLAGLPQLAENLGFDLRALTGSVTRESYLERFGTGDRGKYSPLAVDALAQFVAAHSTPADSVYVFGFASGGVYATSERRSASRFFWSRPVVLEFAADQRGYGSTGLLEDLIGDPPAIVALQKRDWAIGEATVPNSIDFFMHTPPLRDWLNAGYVFDHEDTVFSVWRRKA